MFGIFERGNRYFSIFLLIIAVILVFLTRGGGLGSFGLARVNGGKNEIDGEEEKDNVSVLYSRTIGRVTEAEIKNSEEPTEEIEVLYTRNVGVVGEDEGETKVLYSRKVD